MKDIVIPIYPTAIDFNMPNKINRTFFEIKTHIESEIIPNKIITLKAGFYFKDFYYQIIPSDFFGENKIISNGKISINKEPSLQYFLFSKDKKDEFFSPRYEKIEKNTCIFYINILSSSNEENYIFNIVK
jgi:hypothetical protein